MRPYKKILIVKPSSLGDVVHSLAFLNAVRACFPKAEIHWIIARGLEDLLADHPMINRLVVIEKDTWKRISKVGSTFREVRTLFRTLRAEKYDLVVDLQGLLRSGLITRATGAPVRIGFAEAREGSRLFYTLKVRGGRDVHAVDRYLKIAEALGCTPNGVVFPFPLFKEPDGPAEAFKRQNPEYAVIVPGARWKTKIWPGEYFGRIAAALPMRSLIVGSGADAERAGLIEKLSGGKAVSLAGRTGLRELIGIIRDAKIVFTNDSGPMHIAAGFRVPVVAVFGPTSPQRTGPYGQGHLVIRSELACAPCFKRACKTTRCMEEISPERLLSEITAAGFFGELLKG